jgi:copper chaperone CopZ
VKSLAWILSVFLLVAVAASSMAADAAGLDKALAAPGTLRSVFFVQGMSCRACTTILEKRIANTPGVLWSRFNFPLRLLTVYHDPRSVSRDGISALVNDSGELDAVFLSGADASGLNPVKRDTLAEWKGKKVSVNDAAAILRPFENVLAELLGETRELPQARYEILGEHVRNRIILEAAKKAGYERKARAEDFPPVMAKDFYWPETLRPLTADEKIIASFIEEEVTKKDPERSGKLFDAWLLALWRGLNFNFYGEFAEGKPKP